MSRFKMMVAWVLLCALAAPQAVLAGKPWLVLPPIPQLPTPDRSSTVHVNHIDLWYAEYGSGKPVILLHGGLGNSNWWGLQIPALAKHYHVIVIDSRGQGRSSHDPKATMTYRLMAQDVLALMDHLKIARAAIVGWSDGSITGLEMAIHHPERVGKLFAFGANTTPAGYVGSSGRSPAQQAVVDKYSRLMRSGYMKLSPTPDDYEAFHAKMSNLWNTRPNISAEQLQGITVPTWIVDGDHDEIIRRKDIDFQFRQIPGALELILPGTSHFAFLQKPEMANAVLLRFMAWQPQDIDTH